MSEMGPYRVIKPHPTTDDPWGCSGPDFYEECKSYDHAMEMSIHMNYAHAAAAIASKPPACDKLRQFAEDMAEHDCAYPNDPCLSVHISEIGHGMCTGCKARAALADAGKEGA